MKATNEALHYAGRYVIRTERQGNTLLYDVLSRSGMLTAAGFIMLGAQMAEKSAITAILRRYQGKR